MVFNKPVEIVYELKDEYQIPTFEEFMKDYQADEKVNYDDLERNDIGDSKGYGSCIINDQVVVNSNCRHTREEIDEQIKWLRSRSLSRRFRAEFTTIGNFFTNHLGFLNVGGDTVSWTERSNWGTAFNIVVGLSSSSNVGLLRQPNYRASSITLRNIEQLRCLLRAFENDMILSGSISISSRENSSESTIRELINKHERGEDISGSYLI